MTYKLPAQKQFVVKAWTQDLDFNHIDKFVYFSEKIENHLFCSKDWELKRFISKKKTLKNHVFCSILCDTHL